MFTVVLTGTFSLLSAIIGGLISAYSTARSDSRHHQESLEQEQNRQLEEHRGWLRDKKTDLYIILTGLLEKIHIPIDPETGTVNEDVIRENIDEIAEWISANKGMLSLFLPSDIYRELISLQGKLFQLWDNEALQHIDSNNLKDSFIFECVMQAKKVESLLKKDLGIE